MCFVACCLVLYAQSTVLRAWMEKVLAGYPLKRGAACMHSERYDTPASQKLTRPAL